MLLTAFPLDRLQELDDPVQKIEALQILMKTQTGREFAFTPAMAESVAVIRVNVDSFTAKARPMA